MTEFASAEGTRIFERQSVLVLVYDFVGKQSGRSTVGKWANFCGVYLWRHLRHVRVIASLAFQSHLSSWFIFVLHVRYANGVIEKL